MKSLESLENHHANLNTNTSVHKYATCTVTISENSTESMGNLLETAVMVVNEVDSSCLDYCNSLVYHTTKANITRLQRVWHALCCIVSRLNGSSYVSPQLNTLCTIE